MEKINILIFDDHEVFLDGMKFALEDNPNLAVDTVLSENKFREKISQINYDVFIFDFMIPDTNVLDLISMIQLNHKTAKIIVISSLADKTLAATLREKNVNGYLFKSDARSHINQAIQKILKGENFYSEPSSVEFSKLESLVNPLESLTEKEKEIIRYIAKGYKNVNIAKELNISPRTVEAHKRNVDMKIGKLTKTQITKLVENWKL